MDEKFKHHEFNESCKIMSEVIRQRVNDVDRVLNEFPNCRETSLAKTRLEECLMWANKSLALHGEDMEVKRNER